MTMARDGQVPGRHSVRVGGRALRRWTDRLRVGLAAVGLAAVAASAAESPAAVQALAIAYEQEVDRRMPLPPEVQAGYAAAMVGALEAAGVAINQPQLLLVVDRQARAQLAMVWWLAPTGEAVLIGASPASTGLPSGFEHFETPVGVFEHALANPDFRALGTPNALGIRGYGRKSMRVFDFGWVMAARGWAPGSQPMRLQVHATDPDRLEPLLGRRRSKGCIRLPAAMVDFLDRHAVLDAAYEEAMALGRQFWVLRPDRVPTPWSGRYLLVVDSGDAHPPLPTQPVR